MATLNRDLRKQLEKTVTDARKAAEEGARKALEELAVHHHEPWSTMSPEQRKLRNRLRAHGRQLGDRQDAKGAQSIERLKGECAYEHWHRMLFARFLAECDVLIEPESGVSITLDDCRELARERGVDWLALASDLAIRMLPQIFRAGDPVLEVSLPPEARQALEQLLKSLPRDVFLADDSLGWVYQFWQDELKDRINESEVKIGADELPAVTQLFTEDYMVLFLLHNTLGAWWAGKVLQRRPDLAASAASEEELRAACSVGGVDWAYLRFAHKDGRWRPAAGTFDAWPRAAKDITILDPCMGSGHFLAFALRILVSFRIEEERLTREDGVYAVLRDNLFGLELDSRCTQIAAFNLALVAWRTIGAVRELPSLNLACSGLGINAKEEYWLNLAGGDERLRETMKQLYRLFGEAPILGSLIDPIRLGGTLLAAEFEQARPLLEKAMLAEESNETSGELAITAEGVLKAARIMMNAFTLIATNVPYLGSAKQHTSLSSYCRDFHPEAKADLATCMVDRCLRFCISGGSIAAVTRQEALFLSSYRRFRERLVREAKWEILAKIGEHGFESAQAAGAFTVLLCLSRHSPAAASFAILDVADEKTPSEKAGSLLQQPLRFLNQREQLHNPDARIVFGEPIRGSLLAQYANAYWGQGTGDFQRFGRKFFELPFVTSDYEFMQSTVTKPIEWGGRDSVVFWQKGEGDLLKLAEELRHRLKNIHCRGQEAWGKSGVCISLMRQLLATRYEGQIFDGNCAAVIPKDTRYLPAIWAFCASPEFNAAVRSIDQKLNLTNHTLLKIPFDYTLWNQVAMERYPRGLSQPSSDDPTQWLFNGMPRDAQHSLQTAAARLLGYRWPRQTGSSFVDCPSLDSDGVDDYSVEDGIVCLTSIKSEAPGADRLRDLLAAAYGNDWSPAKQAQLLAQIGYGGKTLEEWLRDAFFEQHCELFLDRPFVWHIWDGRSDGFHALVNYHKLAAPNEEGRRTFEKLIYTYLGDWIDRQRTDQKKGVEGSDARLAAAQHLQLELKKILDGEKPYDIFVRWKPLHEQPIGWEPDINDGIRINIRPFITARPLNAKAKNASILRVTPKIKWDKDRGKEPRRPKEDYPWFWGWDGKAEDFAGGREFDGNRWNNLHYSLQRKQEARENQARRAREQRA